MSLRTKHVKGGFIRRFLNALQGPNKWFLTKAVDICSQLSGPLILVLCPQISKLIG